MIVDMDLRFIRLMFRISDLKNRGPRRTKVLLSHCRAFAFTIQALQPERGSKNYLAHPVTIFLLRSASSQARRDGKTGYLDSYMLH